MAIVVVTGSSGSIRLGSYTLSVSFFLGICTICGRKGKKTKAKEDIHPQQKQKFERRKPIIDEVEAKELKSKPSVVNI